MEGDDPQEPLPPGKYTMSFDDSDTIVVDLAATGLHNTVVPIMYRRGGDTVSVVGTAFCIGASPATGEALFVTARHVVECLDPPTGDIEPFVCLPTTTDPKDWGLHGVRITQISLVDSFCDVALFVVNANERPTGPEVKSLHVSFAAPATDRNCMALGYPQEQGSIRYDMIAARGCIEEVHRMRRDRSMISFPNFRTTGHYASGMSGGPIFDSGKTEDPTARVIGVVSTGMDSSDGSALGYGACLGGILELKVDLHADDGELHEFSIPDLLAIGFIKRSDDDVTLQRNEDGVELRWI